MKVSGVSFQFDAAQPANSRIVRDSVRLGPQSPCRCDTMNWMQLSASVAKLVDCHPFFAVCE